jgi:PTS system cellobiose-specific IIC component
MENNKYVIKALEVSSRIASNRYLDSISKGLMATLPILMIGSLALLLGVFPYDPWIEFVQSVGIEKYFLAASTVTTSCLSIYASFLIGYQLAGHFKQNQIPAGIVSLFAFFITTPLTDDGGLTMAFMGARGLFGAMFAALIATRLYCLLMGKEKLKIHMPDGVPPMIASMFSSLVPAILVGFTFIFISFGFSFTSWGSFSQMVYSSIVTPLNSLGGSVWSLVVLLLVQMFLWFFGIHGSNVISGVITAVYLPMATANMEAYAAGKELPNILGNTFYNAYSGIGGAGGTLSLCIIILLFAKSKQNKEMGKLGIVPGLFTINEPVVFGYPLIMNPLLAIPFILTPIVQTLVAYFAMASGIVPKLTGVQVPWCLPVIIKPLLSGGWQAAVLQVVCVIVGCLVWYPFFKLSDKQSYQKEMHITQSE